MKLTTVPPKLDSIPLGVFTDADDSPLESHASYEGQRFDSANFVHADLTGTAFSECEFLNLTANECTLRGTVFVDTRFDRLNAPIFAAPFSRFHNVEINRSRIGSAEFYEASWRSVHFINCKLGYLNLRGAEIWDVLFTDCSIEELDLGGTKANRVSFGNTTVNSMDLAHSTLHHVDLRSIELRSITGISGLRGATVTLHQIEELAPLFASENGIKVEG